MTATPAILTYTLREWASGAVLVVAYLASSQLAAVYGGAPVIFHIATAVSISVLFFNGLRLWWMVWLAALITGYFMSARPTELVFIPIGETLVAVIAASTLARLSLDPIFRKFRDMLSLIVTVFAVSSIPPSIHYITDYLSHQYYGATLPVAGLWSSGYAAAACTLLIVTPFLLRWSGKRRFGRNLREIGELVGVFGVLVALNYLIFYEQVVRVAGISLVYFLLIPLFWIALRLRPRFVTLAFLVTGGMAVHSALAHVQTPERLFATEGFLIVLTVIFYVIVSLEEERRLHANLMRQQLATLENAVARISSESKAKNDFIAVLAHELRNPLAPVVSGIDLMKLKKDRDPEELETLNVMEDRMHMVRRLLDDLLDISRITENKLRVKDEAVDLDTTIRHAILSTEHYRKERHQTLVYKGTNEPLIVAGDSARLEQMVSNLLTNASKYSDPGGHVTVKLTRTGEQARIDIKDNGIGIDPSLLESVSTPFHQIESGKRSIKGLGIGLALVRSFVEMHGGTVEARSAGKGEGSEFAVTLPLANDADLAEEGAAAPATSKRVKRRKVLIVDDNDSAASGIGRLLEIQGHEALYAYDGEQALELAAAKSPDIILLDLDLPDMDGYQVAAKLHAREYKGRLIALTGLSTADAKTKGVAAGFEQYLLKPVGVEELKRALTARVAK